MIKYLIPLFLLLVMACDRAPEESVDSESSALVSKLDSILIPYVEELRALTDNSAGLAIGVLRGDSIRYTRYFGYADVAEKRKVDRSTRFHIASLSKPFVAVAILKLNEQGRLQLEDRVVDHIPEFQMKTTNYDQITIKELLTHTSGIPANVKADDWVDPSYGETALEENLEHLSHAELDFEPGSSFSYSNAAYDLLGLIIQRVSEQSFSSFVQEQVLVPVGMPHSGYVLDSEAEERDLAQSHSYGLSTMLWKPYPYNERTFPSSGLLATMDDMLNWAQVHLNQGKVGPHPVIDTTSMQSLLRPQAETPWGEKIGLSWFLQSYLNRPIIMHQGQDTGFESLMYIYPEDDVAIVVLANRDFSRTARIIYATSEVLFENEIKPFEVAAKYKFAETYADSGIQKAKEVWEALENDTTDIYYSSRDQLLTTGANLDNEGKWLEAEEVLSYYHSLGSESTYSQRLLGNAFLGLGDTVQARAHYMRCLEIDPSYQKAMNALEKLRSE